MNTTASRMPFGISRDLGILAATMFFWGLGEGLFIFFYPLALQQWDTDPVQIGAVLSVLGITMALVQIPAGYLSDRFGPRILIRAGLILGVIAAAIMAVAQTYPVFITGLIAYTLTSFIVAPINSYITGMRGDWSAQRAMTFISGFFQVGAIIGPVMGGWIGQTAGFSVVFGVSAVLFFVATGIGFFARRPVAGQDAQESGPLVANPLANPRFIGLLVLIFFTIIALSTPQQLTSMYLQEAHHLSLQQVGLTGTFAGIGTAVILFALGSLRAPAGMVVGQVLIGLFSLFMWRGQSAAVFYAGYLFIGGYRLYRSMAMAFVRPLVSIGNVGLAYGLVETGNALAVILAPLAAGFLYRYNPGSVYTASLAALAVTITWTGLLVSKKPKAVLPS